MSGTKRVLGIAALGLMAMLAGSACGDDEDEFDVVVLDPPADEIDTDDDLVVSVSEWDATFAVWDVNGDGKLNDVEFLFNDAAFIDVDVDANDRISAAEWTETFAFWDLDVDGFLDFAEFDPWI